MANGWTPERRARQAELIRTWKPWEKSSGPKTVDGKAVVSRNYLKSGRHRLRMLLPAFQVAALRGDTRTLLELAEIIAGRTAGADSKPVEKRA